MNNIRHAVPGNIAFQQPIGTAAPLEVFTVRRARKQLPYTSAIGVNTLINLDRLGRFRLFIFEEKAQGTQVDRNNTDFMTSLNQSFCLVTKKDAIYVCRIIGIPRRQNKNMQFPWTFQMLVFIAIQTALN